MIGISIAWNISCGVSACTIAKGSRSSTTRRRNCWPNSFWKAVAREVQASILRLRWLEEELTGRLPYSRAGQCPDRQGRKFPAPRHDYVLPVRARGTERLRRARTGSASRHARTARATDDPE